MKRQKDILVITLAIFLLILIGSFMIGILASYPNASCTSQIQKNCQAFLIAGQIQYIANSIFGFILTIIPLLFSLTLYFVWYFRDKKTEVKQLFQKRLQKVSIVAILISFVTTMNSFTILFSSSKSLFDMVFRGGFSFLGTSLGFCSYICIPLFYVLLTLKFMQLVSEKNQSLAISH